MGHGIFREYGHAIAADELGQRMVDLGIDMVGTTRQHDAVAVVLLDPTQRLLALGAHGRLEVEVGLPREIDGIGNLDARRPLHGQHVDTLSPEVFLALLDQMLEEALLEGLLVVIGNEWVEELRAAVLELVDVELESLGVAHDDGTVVMVVCALVLLTLPADAGHPDEVDVLVEQIHDVTVRQLGRIAGVFRGHGLDASLVGLLGGLVRQHHAIAKMREEAVPERIVLVHVERTRNAHGTVLGSLLDERLAVEEQLFLVREEIGNLLGGLLDAGTTLATIAGDEATMLAGLLVNAEVVDGEQAVVLAASATHRRMLDFELVDLLGAQQRRLRARRAITRQQRGTPGAHVAGDVGTDGVMLAQVLERTQDGVVEEGAALNHRMFAQLGGIAQLDDLEQRVLDDGIRQARRDVCRRRTLFLRLFDAGIHEDGAAAAKIDGGLGLEGLGGEVLDGHVERGRECLDERTATRRARLVKHDVLDDAVLDMHALHVLAADVEDEVDVGAQLAGTAQMRNRLNLAGVGLDSLEQQCLAIPRRGGMPNGHERITICIARNLACKVAEHGTSRPEHVALVVDVVAIEDLALLTHEHRLERRGSGIDAKIGNATIAREARLGPRCLGMTLAKRLVFALIREQRLETLHLAALDAAQVPHALLELGQTHDVVVGLGGKCRAPSDEQVRLLGDDSRLVGELERLDETLAQLRQVMQRTAQKGDVSANGTTASEARDGLHDDGLEDRRGNVLALGALVEQRLHIRLGEYAAARCDWIDDVVLLGHLI